MGACSSAAYAAAVAPKADGPKTMTLRLKISCTNGCGVAVCREVKSHLGDRLSNATHGAVVIRGGICGSYKIGVVTTDCTFKVPLQVDCHQLISENAGGGHEAHFATTAKQIIASEIQSKVKVLLGSRLATAAGGVAAPLVSCSVA
eukprot:TRINITY_DN7292_c0_g1_i1.p1 TRINITY_DN7292_c0_g1~~TRINITY_DN7292_c0_g1_i1.p1  ORF type:complete len:164 (-),score=22.39 TRINITY_DN7292_c0_g1_i1:376-813(-)